MLSVLFVHTNQLHVNLLANKILRHICTWRSEASRSLSVLVQNKIDWIFTKFRWKSWRLSRSKRFNVDVQRNKERVFQIPPVCHACRSRPTTTFLLLFAAFFSFCSTFWSRGKKNVNAFTRNQHFDKYFLLTCRSVTIVSFIFAGFTHAYFYASAFFSIAGAESRKTNQELVQKIALLSPQRVRISQANNWANMYVTKRSMEIPEMPANKTYCVYVDPIEIFLQLCYLKQCLYCRRFVDKFLRILCDSRVLHKIPSKHYAIHVKLLFIVMALSGVIEGCVMSKSLGSLRVTMVAV